ncbi:acyl-CoA dehydrogenase, partial [bacterium]|nr:acyl-CoA dehydrogenase [bacterium]
MAEHPMQLRDLRFALFEHLDIARALEADREQLDLILDAAAKFSRDVLAPLNPKGDEEAAVVRHDDGRVTTAPGYKDAYDRYREDGWPTMAAPPEDGGQGLPQALITAIDELGI